MACEKKLNFLNERINNQYIKQLIDSKKSNKIDSTSDISNVVLPHYDSVNYNTKYVLRIR